MQPTAVRAGLIARDAHTVDVAVAYAAPIRLFTNRTGAFPSDSEPIVHTATFSAGRRQPFAASRSMITDASFIVTSLIG